MQFNLTIEKGGHIKEQHINNNSWSSPFSQISQKKTTHYFGLGELMLFKIGYV